MDGGGGVGLINPNPVVHERRATPAGSARPAASGSASAALVDDDEAGVDAFDAVEHIRDINDPEHPYTLEQLRVVSENDIAVDDPKALVCVQFTPTVQHCSMATLIGLCIRVKLMRSLPPRFKVDILVSPGSHASEQAVNKQLNDKERVAAALENPHLLDMVEKCLAGNLERY
eukprot:jgi/Chlat1/748/Chrsp104S01303